MADRFFIIDMQHHYIPQEALNLSRKTDEFDLATELKHTPERFKILSDIDLHLKWMDESGIDMAILSTSCFCSTGFDFCKACNNQYSKVIKEHHDRFRGVIHIYPLDDQKRNEEEVKRGVEELDLWGIGVNSSFPNVTIDSPLMNPIYELAIRYDMPVFVHPTVRRTIWGGERYDLWHTLAREYDIGKSFVEMIYGVLPRFPGLKVIYSHLGGGLPTLKGRLMAWHQPEHFDLSNDDRGRGLAINEAKELGLVDDFESKLEKMWFDSAGFGGWLPVVKSAFEALGSDHLCFGTDYPYELRRPKYLREIIDDINDIGVPSVEKEKFFSSNLKALFCIQ